MGFSRQEHWSGLPCLPPGNFPNPGVELISLISQKLTDRFFTTSATWKPLKLPCSAVLSHSVVFDSLRWTVAHKTPLSMLILKTIQEWVAMLPPGDLSNPWTKPRSPTLQKDSLPSEPPGKHKNTRVASLLQGIFRTEELNHSLLHFREMFYRLSDQLKLSQDRQSHYSAYTLKK